MVPNHFIASQALEPDVLIAVGKLAIGGQLVMIGDHCQLPPTVLSHKPWLNNAAAADSSSSASNTLLGKSLFERLARYSQQMKRGEKRRLGRTPPSRGGCGMEPAEGGDHDEFDGHQERDDYTSRSFESSEASRSVIDAQTGRPAMLMLRTQYRMHPSISAWPNAAFYGGILTDGKIGSSTCDDDDDDDDDGLSLAVRGLRWARITESNDVRAGSSAAPQTRGGRPTSRSRHSRVRFLDVADGVEENDFRSKRNLVEVEVLLDIVRAVLCGADQAEASARVASADDIVLLAPYASQVRSIQQRLIKVAEEQEKKARLVASEFGPTGSAATVALDEASDVPKEEWPEGASKLLRRIEVKTVDGFQGREKALVVLSTVRASRSSNNNGGKSTTDITDIGFLADWRRMNVALTRATSGVVVVGDRSALSSDPMWASWIRHCDEMGLSCTRTSDLLCC